jgi:hypothetical protein
VLIFDRIIGSSLTVTPAADIPRRVAKRKKKLIIGNLQRTPLYNHATVNIHAFSDTIMQDLMKRLNIPIPPWILRRRVRVTWQHDDDQHKSTITIEGRDPDNANIPFTLFESIQMIIDDRPKKEFNGEPFVIEISNKNVQLITVRLHFFGHYNEIPFDLHYTSVKNVPKEEQFYLFYNPLKGEWRKTIDETDLPV